MRFIVDAHLPPALVHWLRYRSYDALHTLDLADGNATSDVTILQLSVQEQRIVISKGRDFIEHLLLTNRPYKLLALTVGNTLTRPLLALFDRNWPVLIDLLAEHRFVELRADTIVVHF